VRLPPRPPSGTFFLNSLVEKGERPVVLVIEADGSNPQRGMPDGVGTLRGDPFSPPSERRIPAKPPYSVRGSPSGASPSASRTRTTLGPALSTRIVRASELAPDLRRGTSRGVYATYIPTRPSYAPRASRGSPSYGPGNDTSRITPHDSREIWASFEGSLKPPSRAPTGQAEPTRVSAGGALPLLVFQSGFREIHMPGSPRQLTGGVVKSRTNFEPCPHTESV